MSTSKRAPAFLPIRIIRKPTEIQIRLGGPKALLRLRYGGPGEYTRDDAEMLATLVARTLRGVWEGH